MKTFLSQTTLARRLNLAPATLANRIRERRVEIDAVVQNGGKASALFDTEKLPQLRNVLVPPQSPERKTPV